MYVADRERRDSLTVASSIGDWLASLDVRVQANPVSADNLKRIVQLMNKTNQLNMRTRRTSEKELLQWLEGGCGRRCFGGGDRLRPVWRSRPDRRHQLGAGRNDG